MKLSHLPIRLTAGLFLLHTAAMKREADEEATARFHQLGVSGYPFLKRLRPETFVRSMAAYELGTAAVLLTPVVPSVIGGMAVGTLGSALFGLYLRAPGMRTAGSIRPTMAGLTVAKDSWLAAIGATLVFDYVTDSFTRRQGRS